MRIILHIDMDYFFAQIEERENPQFKGKPLIVGADPRGGRGRGVVSTCNYEARKFGIKSGMPISKAYNLCPTAIFLPPNMELYKKVSEEIMGLVKKYSLKYEIVSLDEAYLDISEETEILKNIKTFGMKKGIEKSYEIAKTLGIKLKEEIFEKEKLTSTVGIGPNKTIAKIASDKAKPNGILVIKPEAVQSFLDVLDVENIPGVGPKTAEKLRKIGVNKIFQLRNLSKEKLKEIFGRVGEKIWEKAHGIDEEPVECQEVVKSIGKQITFEKDTRNAKLIFDFFEKIIKEVYCELQKNNFSFRTITVVCRYKGFETHSKAKTLKGPSRELRVLTKEAKKLLLRFFLENKKPIRLIGLRIKIC